MSGALLDHPSEYHFLFDRVMYGVENPDDHNTLFLLPNAARRLLESFVSFVAPHRPNFEAQLKKVAIEDCDNAYRDVYDFCNRYSHGEGRETLVTLDPASVAEQLRRCMELLQAVNPDHFDAMCEVTNRRGFELPQPLAAEEHGDAVPDLEESPTP